MSKLNLIIVGFMMLIISGLNSCNLVDDDDKLYKGSDIVGKWVLTEATCNGEPYEWTSYDFYEFDEYGWVDKGWIEKGVASSITRYEYVGGKVYIGYCYDWGNDLEAISPEFVKEGQCLVQEFTMNNYYCKVKFNKQ